MLTCYILDDERAAITILTKYIGDTPNLRLAGSSTDVLSSAAFLGEQSVDLLFLDIEMPKLTGPQFMDLYARNTPVIFTTAYSQYALEGYDRGVVDYLMKPIAYERFLKAIERVRNLVSQRVSSEPEPVGTNEFIVVKTEHKGKFQKVNLSDIVYVEGLKNYVTIVTRQGERIVTYVGIGDLETRLPVSHFIRVHRSYIIALDSVLSIDGNEIYLANAPRIPTAGGYKDDLFRRLQHHLVQGKRP
ncbi:LytTR family DNA-binding domain-containing protein [Spirosoma horti]